MKKRTKILVKKLHPDGGIHQPKLAGDVGHDIIAAQDVTVPALPHPTATLIPSKVVIAPPEGYWFQILGRSSTANKRGLMVVPAVIDNLYRGELAACVFNMTDKPIEVKKGERVAQAVFFKAEVFEFEEVEELEETERGVKGYGSSGL